jgi:DNA-binding GntR family transcriptional regulator
MDVSTPEQRQYMRIAATVRDDIASGVLAPASKVPSITELTGKLGCSRRTATKGMKVLEDEGLIYRQIGLGWFVTVSGQHHGKAR